MGSYVPQVLQQVGGDEPIEPRVEYSLEVVLNERPSRSLEGPDRGKPSTRGLDQLGAELGGLDHRVLAETLVKSSRQ
eukprot:10469595-Heterocapsa_arctica.AAC.1